VGLLDAHLKAATFGQKYVARTSTFCGFTSSAGGGNGRSVGAISISLYQSRRRANDPGKVEMLNKLTTGTIKGAL
jgi:hypothetical protein